MVTEQERQAIVDETQLDLLPVAYWVSAGFWGAYGLFMAAYFVLIGAVFSAIPADGSDAPPDELGWIFLAMALFLVVVMGTLVVLKVLAGFWIRKRKHRVATMLVAAMTCMEIPYGTLIGVATFIAFARPSVKALYESRAATTSYGQVVQPPPAPPEVGVSDEGTFGDQ